MSIGFQNIAILSSGSSDQDNIARFLTIYVAQTRQARETILGVLNGLSFTIEKDEEYYLIVYLTAPTPNDDRYVTSVQKYKFRDIGAGTYGDGGTQITGENLELMYERTPSLEDFENNPLTQKLIIDDLLGLSVRDYVRELNPAFNFQDVSIAPRLVKITEVGKEADYLFLAPGGSYGFGFLQANTEDFQPLDYGNESDLEIKITTFSQLTNTELRSDKVYVLQNNIVQETLDEIIVPTDGLTIIGGGYDLTTISSAVPNATLFKSAVGGCGNFRLKGLSVSNIGIGSQAFDLEDKGLTQHEVGFTNVNLSGSVSLGKLRNFRQFVCDDLGFYGCQDGLIFSGAWNGAKITNTNLSGFNASGTLFKKDVDTTFANRFFIGANLSFPIGAELCDFTSDNFLSNELLQINGSQIKVNGIINADLGADLIPNLTANDLKCKWTGNSGVPNSAIQNFVKNDNVSGYFNIDWLKDTYLLTMTGDTIFTESSLPANGKNTQVINIALRGDFVAIFPEHWETNLVGTYKGSDLNNITVKFIEENVYLMKIDNSLSVYPAPSLQNLVPTSLLPSNTAQLTINGSFFTPQTIVKIQNQTVNSVEFVNQGQLILSVTTSAVEEEVDITISNGTTVIFSGVLPINLGVVFIPSEADWNSVIGSANISQSGKIYTTIFDSNSSGDWDKQLDFTKDFIFQFRIKPSILNTEAFNNTSFFTLKNVSNNNLKLQLNYAGGTSDLYSGQLEVRFNGSYNNYLIGITQTTINKLIQFRWIDGVLYFYLNNVLEKTFDNTQIFTENVYLSYLVKTIDIIDIKYIELP
jgi:hypothetical protein